MEEIIQPEEIKETAEGVEGDNEFSFKKINAPDFAKTNVVLILAGHFYPINLQHLKVLESAKEYVLNNKPDINIMGSFLIPLHLEPLTKITKIKLTQLLPMRTHIITMTKLLVQDIPSVEVDLSLLESKRDKGLDKSIRLLEDRLNRKYNLCALKKPKQIQTILILGADKLEDGFPLQKTQITIVVGDSKDPNFREVQDNITEQIQLDKSDKMKQNIIIVEFEKLFEEDNLSHLIRQMNNEKQDFSSFVSPLLFNFHVTNMIKYPIGQIKKQSAILEATKDLKDIISEDVLIIDFSEIKMSNEKYLLTLSEIPKNQQQQQQEEDLPFEYIGKGAQARVFKAKYKGNEVAVKAYEVYSNKSKSLQCFEREIRALSRIKHENCIKLIGVSKYQHLFFIVMELVESQNILDFISRNKKYWPIKPLFPEFVLALSELCQGLEKMQNVDILHRDIQAKNILYSQVASDFNNKVTDVKRNFTLKICDFGLSAIEEDKESIVRGSTRHYSPQSIQDKKCYSKSCDVYMFGNVLWEMIYVKTIFLKFGVGEVHEKIMNGEREIIDARCPEEIKVIIEGCWQHEPDKRSSFQQISEQIYKYYQKIIEKE